MPWKSTDAESHTGKANTEKKQKQWATIANSVLERCISDGGDQKVCEQKAIIQANGVIAKFGEYDVVSNYNYLTELKDSDIKSLADTTTITIDVFREGKWYHPKHGIIEGNQQLFEDFIKNWKNNVLGRDIMFDQNHKPEDGGTGLVKDLFIEGDKLRAKVELTNFGKDLIQNKGFRYFSPEYTNKYISKDTNKEIKNVLIGGALTLRPFLTNLSPIVLSEDIKLDTMVSPANQMQPVTVDYLPIDTYELVCSFVNIIRSLALADYITVQELKDFMLNYLYKVDFTKLDDEFKNELLLLFEEYIDNVDKKG